MVVNQPKNELLKGRFNLFLQSIMKSSPQNSYSIPISIREWLVCILSALTLVFSAWSFGGYENWALHILFYGGVGTLLLSVLPMPSYWNGFDQLHGNLKNCKRLFAQPFFWVSLSFLGYILIQYLNPSIIQVSGKNHGGLSH